MSRGCARIQALKLVSNRCAFCDFRLGWPLFRELRLTFAIVIVPSRPLLMPSYHFSLDYTILLLSFLLLLHPPHLGIHERNSLCMLALVDEPENALRASFRLAVMKACLLLP